MKRLLLTASTLALGLGLATPVLAESDCDYPPCVPNPGTALPGSAAGDGRAPAVPDERDDRDTTAPATVAPGPGPAPDSCGDGCGDDSSAGSLGDAVFLTLADLRDLGLA